MSVAREGLTERILSVPSPFRRTKKCRYLLQVSAFFIYVGGIRLPMPRHRHRVPFGFSHIKHKNAAPFGAAFLYTVRKGLGFFLVDDGDLALLPHNAGSDDGNRQHSQNDETNQTQNHGVTA